MAEDKKMTGYPSVDRPWEKYYSDDVKEFDFPKTTMYRCIYDNNKQHLNRIAMEYYGRSFSYQDLFAGIDKTAKALGKIGVKRGEIITIAMPTTPETVYLLYAISKIGAVANMIDPRTSKEGIVEYTREAGSKLFITIDLCYPKIKEIVTETNVQTIISISVAESLPAKVRLAYQTAEAASLLTGKKERIIESKNLMKWQRFISLADNAAEINENLESSLVDLFLTKGEGPFLLSAAVIIGISTITVNSIVFSSRNQIKGLTTSVALWGTAILGLACGAGSYTMVLIIFFTLIMLLSGFPAMETSLKNRSNHFEVHLELVDSKFLQNFVTTIRKLGLTIDDIELNPAYAFSGLSVYSISISINNEELKKYKSHKEIIEALSTLDYIYYIEEMRS